MHWYDKHVMEYKQYCLGNGWRSFECDGDCRWCDEFLQDFADCVGLNERICPYNYQTQEEYASACEFANEADDIVSDEAPKWWRGDPGYIQGISSPAIDPRDFNNREEYKEALYRHLFSETIAHNPAIPQSELWYRVFSDFLEDSESVFCAEKSLVCLLDELISNNDSASLSTELYCSSEINVPPINYSYYDPLFDSRKKYYPNRYGCYPVSWFEKPKYTQQQFLQDLLHKYPGLYSLIRHVIHDEQFEDDDENWPLHKANSLKYHIPQYALVKDYLMVIFSNALYFHDLLGLDVEECVQNGLIGFTKARKNGYWEEYIPSWIWKYDYDERHHQYLCWEIRLHMLQFSMELADVFGSEPTRQMVKAIDAIIRDHTSIKNLSEYIFSSESRRQADVEYAKRQVKRFFATLEIPKAPQLSDDIADVNVDHIYQDEAKEFLKKLILQLPDRERTCLILRYGLESGTPMTLEETGNKLLLSRERVRQIEHKAFEFLKKLPGYADLCELTGNPIPKGAKHRIYVQKKSYEATTEAKPVFQLENNIANTLPYAESRTTPSHVPEHRAQMQNNKMITNLELSARTLNCLMRMGIRTIDDIIYADAKQLDTIYFDSPQSLKELKTLLIAMRLVDFSWVSQVVVRDDDVAKTILRLTTIDDLDLSVRSYNVLKRAGINTLAELVTLERHHFLKLKNIGKRNKIEIIEKAHNHGVKLSDSIEEYYSSLCDSPL